jgi:AAA domain
MGVEARQFEISPAVRRTVGLLIGLVGPSSSGKTYSALRLATGIQRIVGGDIDVIDTENGRALYYADKFKFNHMRFGAPFSPDDYLEAIRFCARRGSKTILIDSMSHEHEGPGGVLEWHERETERLATLWGVSKEKAQMAAWGPPKKSRRRLINEVLQLNVNLIMTFRAKEKIKIVSGKNPIELGWQPICGDEFMYEMVLQALLLPGSEGRPTWTPEMPAERAMIKLPLQFRELFGKAESAQLTEQVGEELARWASGGIKGDPQIETLIADYAKCANRGDLDALETRRKALWTRSLSATFKAQLKEAADAATARLTPIDRISLDQATVLADTLKEEGVELSLLLAEFEIGTLEELPADRYADAKTFISETSSP